MFQLIHSTTKVVLKVPLRTKWNRLVSVQHLKLIEKGNVRLKIAFNGCDQCVWAAGVVAGHDHWILQTITTFYVHF